MKFGRGTSKVISVVASSGFAVYVLHTNRQVFSIMHELSRILIIDWHFPRYIGLIGSAAAIFFGCITIYLVGRISFIPVFCIYRRMLNWVVEKSGFSLDD